MSSASSGASPDRPPSVSVVIPCYNAGATVRRAIASVAAQTFRPQEIVAVDDASADATRDELRSLASELPPGWLRILRLESNQGPGGARNVGWDAASGQWIAFLDADDTWHPRKLDTQLRVLRTHPDADLVAHLHDFGGAPARGLPGAPKVSRVTAGELLIRNRFVTPSVLVRRDVPERFRAGRRHMEDHLLWMDMAYAGRTLLLVHAALATLHKPSFGASGLSAALVAMERAELGNYRILWRERRIGLIALLGLWGWSAAKFARRLLIIAARRVTGSTR